MKRKLVLVLVALVVVAGVALAGEEGKKPKGHKVAAEFVSADANAKTITIKDEKGETLTAPILTDRALAFAKDLKAGEKIVMICRDKDDGSHEGVSGIKLAKAVEKKPM